MLCKVKADKVADMVKTQKQKESHTNFINEKHGWENGRQSAEILPILESTVQGILEFHFFYAPESPSATRIKRKRLEYSITIIKLKVKNRKY